MNQLLSYIDIIYIPKKYYIRAKNNLPSLEEERLANDCNKAQEEIQKVTL